MKLFPTRTLAAFHAEASDIIRASCTAAHISRGCLTLRTRDDHALHAFEHMARRASLRILSTVTDDGTFVLSLKGFLKEAK